MDAVQVLTADEACPELPIVEQGGTARAVVWPGTGAVHRSMHVISLDEGGRTKALTHPSDAVYHLCEGAASVTDPDTGHRQELVVGSMFHVDAGTAYQIESAAAGTVLIGGPCPPDPAMYPPANRDRRGSA